MKEKDLKIKKYKFILNDYEGKETRIVHIFAPDLEIANFIVSKYSKEQGCTYKYESFKRNICLAGIKLEDLDSYEIVKQQLERINSWDVEELPSSKFNEKYPKWCETINYKYDNLPRKRFIIINEDNSFTAIDNRIGKCWCEDFIYKISTIKFFVNKEIHYELLYEEG